MDPRYRLLVYRGAQLWQSGPLFRVVLCLLLLALVCCAWALASGWSRSLAISASAVTTSGVLALAGVVIFAFVESDYRQTITASSLASDPVRRFALALESLGLVAAFVLSTGAMMAATGLGLLRLALALAWVDNRGCGDDSVTIPAEYEATTEAFQRLDDSRLVVLALAVAATVLVLARPAMAMAQPPPSKIGLRLALALLAIGAVACIAVRSKAADARRPLPLLEVPFEFPMEIAIEVPPGRQCRALVSAPVVVMGRGETTMDGSPVDIERVLGSKRELRGHGRPDNQERTRRASRRTAALRR